MNTTEDKYLLIKTRCKLLYTSPTNFDFKNLHALEVQLSQLSTVHDWVLPAHGGECYLCMADNVIVYSWECYLYMADSVTCAWWLTVLPVYGWQCYLCMADSVTCTCLTVLCVYGWHKITDLCNTDMNRLLNCEWLTFKDNRPVHGSQCCSSSNSSFLQQFSGNERLPLSSSCRPWLRCSVEGVKMFSTTTTIIDNLTA